MNDPIVRTTRRASRSFMTVIDRMIALELIKTLLSILLVLVTIIVSRKFLGILTKAIEGEVASETVFSLLGLKTLSAVAILIPPPRSWLYSASWEECTGIMRCQSSRLQEWAPNASSRPCLG